MKNYLVFAFDKHYPHGGMDDFLGNVDSLSQAVDFLKSTDFAEGHVWCCRQNRIIYRKLPIT
jgi:hypothetical protein